MKYLLLVVSSFPRISHSYFHVAGYVGGDPFEIKTPQTFH